MPSKRSTAIIGIWVVLAVVVIVDFFLFYGRLLDSLYFGLNSIAQVLIIAFFPIIAASLLLDRRAQPQEITETPRQRVPRGARSASGNAVTPTRTQPRLKRDKRAAKLETIVVDPQSRSSPTSGGSVLTSANEPGSQASTSSRFLRARRTRTQEDEELDQQVKEQLDALEEEMAKLEGELSQNGIITPSSTPHPESAQTNNTMLTNAESDGQPIITQEISPEEAVSEIKAIDEILQRLEQRKRAGGVDDNTYTRLREKYMKRRSELTGTT